MSSVYILCRDELVEHEKINEYYLTPIHVRTLIILVCGVCTFCDLA